MKMKAIVAIRQGGPEVLEIQDLPVPVPANNQILIKVHAFSINPVDYKIREHGFGLNFPLVLGLDIAGTVISVGADTIKFKIGDAVIAKLPFGTQGGYAEYVLVSDEAAVIKPPSISFEQGAAIPLAALTAWQALFDQGGLKAAQTVLIHGASGGVGLFAVQFALLKGASVIVTASEKNYDRLKSLGVNRLINHTTEKFYNELHDIDLVFDAVGSEETVKHSSDVLKDGGLVVAIAAEAKSARIDSGAVKAVHFMTTDSLSQLVHIIDLVDQGKVLVFIEKVLSFKQVAEAQEIQKKGHVSGKLIIKAD